MSVLTEPHDFLGSFARACAAAGLNHAAILDSYWAHGHVFKGPDYLLLGGPDVRPDAWNVFWAEAWPPERTPRSVARFVRLMPHWRPYVSWARLLKGRPQPRYYLTDRLLALTHDP